MTATLEAPVAEPLPSSTSTAVPSAAPSVLDSNGEEKALQSEPQAESKPQPQRSIRGLRWFLVTLALYLTGFLYGLDTTIAADVQPDIVKSLGEIEKLAWVGTGFPLGSVAIILPLGYAFGLFEIKILYLGSLVLFEAGSALCGGAPNMNALIIGRIIAGAGGAGM